MTEYALAPTRTFTADSPYRTPRVMLEQGLLVAYRVRSNGTMRHLELYPLGSTTREAAEWISDRIDMDGASVQAVARQLNVSTPTVRRFLEGLALTEEVEQGEWDDLSFDNAGNPLWDTTWTEEDSTDDQGTDQVEEILDQLAGMGKPAAEVIAELEATKAAQRPATRTRRTRTARPVADVVKAAGLPWPTDEERAAALADVPGSQCEPVGTPAAEVEQALEASVAQARGAALPVCFCNDLGAHTPGNEGCKNPAPVRRVRSHG